MRYSFVFILLFLSKGSEAMARNPLKKYQEKRHFKKTSEPKGARKSSKKNPIFVIQKHDASHLHYDFRLEIGGVLPSWAIPKGPSLNPTIKRLAMRTEDHPYDYAHFEGTIPEGEYGGGTVMIWDYGTYQNMKDVSMEECLKEGRIEIFLEGEKLQGAFALIRTHFSGKEQWLFFKIDDEYASKKKNPVSTENKSAKSGKTMEEIARGHHKFHEHKKPRKKKREASQDDPSIKIGGTTLEVTNLKTVMFPHDKITKGDLIAYYAMVAPYMIPLIKNRPIMMQRFPDGIDGEAFYQKNASSYFPSWIKTVHVEKEEGGAVDYVLCNNEATLVYLANQACITPHVWLSRADKLDYPDRMIFDLDPSKKDFKFSSIRNAAFDFKKFLESLGMQPFVMTTGSRGVHVVVPIKRTHTFDEVKTIARAIATHMADTYPDQLTVEIRKEKREGKILVDFFRNAFAQTGVAPYAVRAKDGAPIATPISWAELKKISSSQHFTMKNIKRRLSSFKDPWKEIDKHAVSLTSVAKKLEKLKKES